MNIRPILDAIGQATDIKPTAFNSNDIQTLPAIAYQIYKQRDNGASEQWRLTLRLTTEDMATLLDYEEQINDALLTPGDGTPLGCYVEVNGGGTLEDEQTGLPQLIIYYDITARS